MSIKSHGDLKLTEDFFRHFEAKDTENSSLLIFDDQTNTFVIRSSITRDTKLQVLLASVSNEFSRGSPSYAPHTE